jgi:hypothetical protein
MACDGQFPCLARPSLSLLCKTREIISSLFSYSYALFGEEEKERANNSFTIKYFRLFSEIGAP